MELPLRWGSKGVYQDGKPKISCRTFSLHEHAANHLEVTQTRWHPNSPTDSHLLMLLSDNSLRIYDEASLKHVWRVGPVPNYAAVEKNFSYLKSFGDIAVDFDIAPATVSGDQLNDTIDIDVINSTLQSMSLTKKQDVAKKIEWPIIILRGNGTIYVLCAGLNTDKPRLQGPLTVIPAQKDNYGDDSCSLLVIPTLPPTIVIAENSGKLHHLLMIETTTDTSFDDTTTMVQNDWDLYVLETIQLELGLTEDSSLDVPASPVHLKKDSVNEQRYFCYHDTGLHGVTIGFVEQLHQYVDEESEMEPNMNVKSRAEYILSTKAFNSAQLNAIVGIGLLQSPSGMFAIMSSGQIVSLNTIKLMLSIMPEVTSATPSLGEPKSFEKNFKGSFDQHIKTLLKSDVSQPILKLDKTKPPTAQQAFDLLINSMQVMRDNQFVKHDKVRQEIARRVKILEILKSQQSEEIGQLCEEKEQIQEKAYKLADKHEDIMERQQNLQKRVQDVLRLASLRLPPGSSGEKEFSDNIRRIKAKSDKLLQDVKQIKVKNETQKKQIESWSKSSEDCVRALPPKQENTIKEILTDMAKQIAQLQKDVQKVNGVVNA